MNIIGRSYMLITSLPQAATDVFVFGPVGAENTSVSVTIHAVFKQICR